MEYMKSLQGMFDEQKPTLFEILAGNDLNSLLPPSLRYLLAVATHRHPRYLLRILNNFDELYAVLSLVVERYYLQTFQGGLVENFYGMKRERVLRIHGGETTRARLGAPNEVRETLKLRDRDVWKNLAVMVALPYVKRKLDESYDIHAAGVNLLGPAYRDRERYPVDGTFRQKFIWLYKWFLRKVYPSVNAAYYLSMLGFNLVYLFDGTKYHSPFMWLIGTRIRRLIDADRKAMELAKNPPPPPPPPPPSQTGAKPGPTSIFSPRTFSHVIYPQMLSSLRLLLPASIFVLKFLEWWHNSDFAKQLSRKANEGLELPPPVVSGLLPAPRNKSAQKGTEDEKAEKAPSRRDSGVSGPPISSTSFLPILTVPAPSVTAVESETTSAVCPICRSSIQTATAAQTGYVYCYSCIYKWVDGTHPRQEAFMEGTVDEEGAKGWVEEGGGSRFGKWESGVGRDAVTGRSVLGGTSGLRRVMV